MKHAEPEFQDQNKHVAIVPGNENAIELPSFCTYFLKDKHKCLESNFDRVSQSLDVISFLVSFFAAGKSAANITLTVRPLPASNSVVDDDQWLGANRFNVDDRENSGTDLIGTC